jgi:exocyst complex component 4
LSKYSEFNGFVFCSSQPSTLNAFLTNYVKETFLARGHSRSLQLTVESLSKTQDAWRSIINPDEMKRYGLSRPLLQSTVLVENSES